MIVRSPVPASGKGPSTLIRGMSLKKKERKNGFSFDPSLKIFRASSFHVYSVVMKKAARLMVRI